jgi:mannose-6-phosphate isomerase-like protein (cupin superfamily)
MAITLEGGCRVSEMREGAPMVNGTLRIWNQIRRATGAQAISLRVLEFAAGLSPGLRNDNCDEVFYVLDKSWERGGERGHPVRLSERSERTDAESCAKFLIDGWPYEVGPDTGIYLRPSQTLTIDNSEPDPLVLISSQCPEPESSPAFVSPLTAPSPGSVRPEQSPVVYLSDRPAVPTADRWYRVLVNDEVGSIQVTQFVGSIPPGRAPDHFHQYEEVLFILRGQGRMWAGETNTTIAAGSCIYLPRGQVHCVENTGTDELRLLGVFYPAGSPSVRYDV